MTDKTICRNDGRCEYAVQTGAEKEGSCPAGACAMPCDNAAAHLTIPGALEWDGDNGTHGVVGTHSADGDHSESGAAIATLKALGYAHNGGTHWKPSVGQKPDFDLIDDLRAQLDNTEQSRRSFFDLSQDLEKRLTERDALLAKCKDWIEAARDGVLYPVANDFQGVVGNNAEVLGQQSVALLDALSEIPEPAKPESFPCWSCRKSVTLEERAAADGDCPHCAAELDLEDWPSDQSGCTYEVGDWACREGGYLWYSGDGEGWDPEDCTHICPHCRTKDYLEAAKDEAESCSSYSNNGSSGTGLDIWTAAEKLALTANHPAACKALAEIGPVSALDGDDVVICNTQQVAP